MLELLDERIAFCETSIANMPCDFMQSSEKSSDFHKALIDFKYCRVLLLAHTEYPDNTDIKNRYAKTAIEILCQLSDTVQSQLAGYTPMENRHELEDIDKTLNTLFDNVISTTQYNPLKKWVV